MKNNNLSGIRLGFLLATAIFFGISAINQDENNSGTSEHYEGGGFTGALYVVDKEI